MSSYLDRERASEQTHDKTTRLDLSPIELVARLRALSERTNFPPPQMVESLAFSKAAINPIEATKRSLDCAQVDSQQTVHLQPKEV